MRFRSFFGLPLVLALAACSQTPPPAAPAAIAAKPAVATPVAQTAPIAPKAPARSSPPKITRQEIAGVSFEGVAFDSGSHHLVVVDQPGGPGSRFADAEAAGNSRNGLAAINAGFFTPEGAPLGKLIAAGKSAGSWNRGSSLGSGVFYESPAGNPAIARREAVSPAAAQRELLQAGPMLVENGHAVGGLNADKPAARMLVLWDGGSRWWIGRSSICSLAELGNALGQGSPAGWPIKNALNLDGGRSADLWISGKIPGGPIVERPIWNKPVRNFLVLVAR
jgi:hypothetical protein